MGMPSRVPMEPSRAAQQRGPRPKTASCLGSDACIERLIAWLAALMLNPLKQNRAIPLPIQVPGCWVPFEFKSGAESKVQSRVVGPIAGLLRLENFDSKLQNIPSPDEPMGALCQKRANRAPANVEFRSRGFRLQWI
jgi:hypothetical protein